MELDLESSLFAIAIIVLGLVHAWSWRGAALLEKQASGARLALIQIYHNAHDFSAVATAGNALERLYGLSPDDLTRSKN